MTLTDASGQHWEVPAIVWPHVQAINRILRQGAEDLGLPKDKAGQYLTDLHHPDVQNWFNAYPAGPIVVGAVLLGEQVTARKLSEESFAACWRGDAHEVLRKAIWKEWVEYLPPDARSLAIEIENSATTLRAMAVSHLAETFAGIRQLTQQQMEEGLAKMRSHLDPGASATSGSVPGSSESTLPLTP